MFTSWPLLTSQILVVVVVVYVVVEVVMYVVVMVLVLVLVLVLVMAVTTAFISIASSHHNITATTQEDCTGQICQPRKELKNI